MRVVTVSGKLGRLNSILDIYNNARKLYNGFYIIIQEAFLWVI
jgi:hypothetical protein